jgi:biopolymer transport protein TolR
MVITPMLQKGVDVKLPAAANTEDRKDEQKSITVAVKNDATFTTYLNGIKYDNRNDILPQLRERLEDIDEGDKMVFLKADTDLQYSEVMKVMDLLREAGVEQIALIAEQRVEGS